MSRCAGTVGITVSSTTFTDHYCADNAVLFTDDPSGRTQILTCSDAACPVTSTAGMLTQLVKGAGC